jgi:hypothetical protein
LHRRQSRAQRQGVESNPIGVYERLAHDIECIGTALERLDGRRDIVRSPDFRWDDFEAKRASRRLNLTHLQHADGPPVAMIANRWRLGTTSRKGSSRLPAVSVDWIDRPVTLPPGRPRLATKPVPTGSPAAAKTIGITDVACFTAMTDAVAAVTITSTFSRTNSTAISAKRLDCDGATLVPTVLAHTLHKCGSPFGLGGQRERAQEPDGRQLRRLRTHGNRPSRSTAEKCDELAPLHCRPKANDTLHVKLAHRADVRFGSKADIPRRQL